jgi:hypothetical protein
MAGCEMLTRGTMGRDDVGEGGAVELRLYFLESIVEDTSCRTWR